MKTFKLVSLCGALLFIMPFAQAQTTSQCGDAGTPAGLRLIAAGAKPCAKSSVAKLERTPAPRASTKIEITKAKAYFNGVLKDGFSARWKEWKTWPGGYVCGYVNAKNSFGAYTGWSRFWYRAGEGEVVPDGKNTSTYGPKIPCLEGSNYSHSDAMKDSGY